MRKGERVWREGGVKRERKLAENERRKMKVSGGGAGGDIKKRRDRID